MHSLRRRQWRHCRRVGLPMSTPEFLGRLKDGIIFWILVLGIVVVAGTAAFFLLCFFMWGFFPSLYRSLF